MLNNLKHLIRYGTHAEKDFFLGDFSSGYYDAVILNGNMVAYSLGAISAFILRIHSPFLIDPQTHAFQHETEYLLGKNGEPKLSLSKLATFFGDPVRSSLAKKRKISFSDFTSEESKINFVENVSKFQVEAITNKLSSQEEAEYVQYAIKDTDSNLSERDLKPAAIVAPYFFISGNDYKHWLDLNIDLVNKTKKYSTEKCGSMPVVAQLVVSREILGDESKREEVFFAYSVLGCEGFLVWVDSFVEDEMPEKELNDFIKALSTLKTSNKTVHNLYGGYFSILLTKLSNKLDGVCHGLEYGESRGVVPIGGGVPISKYYFPPLHKRLKYADLVKVLRANKWGNNGSKNAEFASSVCDCVQCTDISKFGDSKPGKSDKRGVRRNYPTIEAKQHSLKHYLYSKVREFKSVKKNNLSLLIKDMNDQGKKYLPALGEENVGNLVRWKNVVHPFVEETPSTKAP